MFAAIVSLLFVSVIFLIGYGTRVLKLFRLRAPTMLGLILLTIIACVIPTYDGGNFTLNYLGMWLTLVALVLIIKIVKLRGIPMVLLGSVAICTLALVYRYFAMDYLDTVFGGLLYPIIIALSGYIVSRNSVYMFTNIIIGVGLANLIMWLVPLFYSSTITIGGSGEVMVLAAVLGIVLSELVTTINHFIKPRRNNATKYEAGEDNFDVIDPE